MSNIISTKEDKPEELIRAEKLIDDAKVNEAHDLLNNFEKKEGLTLQDKVLSNLLRIDLLLQQGQYEESLTLAEKTCDLSLGLGKNISYIDCFIFTAKSLNWLGKYDKIPDVLIQAEKLLDSISNVSSSERMKRKASIAQIKGNFHFGRLEMDLAFDYTKQSLELTEKSNFKRLNAINLRVLGYNIALQKGDMELALEYVKKGVKIARESNNKFTIAQCLLNLGIIYSFMGDWEKAINVNEECFLIYEKLGNKERMSTVLSNISEIYKDFTEDYDLALKYAEKSLKVYNEDLNYIFAAHIYSAITIAIKKVDYELAKQYFHRLEQIKNQKKDKRIELYYCMSKALILKLSSRFRDIVESEKILREIIEEKVFDFEYTTQALISLCEILLGEFQLTNNREILKELEPLIGQLLRIAEKTKSFRIQTEIYLFQSKLALLTFDVKKSRRFLTQAQQIAVRHNNDKLIQEISNEQQNLIDHLELWERLKDSEAPLSERFKLARINEQIERMGRTHVIIPTQILEDKVAIHQEKKICLVCRGEVSRFSYICVCGAIYCGNCAQALTELENICWVCDAPIDFSKPVKPYKGDEKVEIQEKSKRK